MPNSTIAPDIDLVHVDLATEKATVNIGILEDQAIDYLLIKPSSSQLPQGTVTSQGLLTKPVN